MLSKNSGDRRRVAEISRQLQTLRKFGSVPFLGQLKDGEGGVVTGTGELYIRDGGKLYRYAGTEV